MAFDPSVISQIPDSGPNPVEARAQGFKLADLINTEQLNKLRLNQVQTEQSDQLKMKETLKPFDLSKPEEITKAAQALSKAGLPQQAMKLMGTAQEYQTGQADAALKQLQVAKGQNNIIAGALDDVYGQLQKLQEAGATPEMLDLRAAQLGGDAIKRLRQQQPEFSTFLDRFASDPKNLTFGGIKQAENASNVHQQKLKDMIAERGVKVKEASEEEKERHDRAMESRTTPGGKAPAGFEWDPDKPDTLRPIAGGPKDPNSKPWSGREKVFSERIVTSANEASRAIKNITELPIGASAGFLGVGKSPGESLFTATKDSLRNSLSSQETQDYNTMLAGVRRNLATIESVGLAPSGSLTEGFASLELRQGDTQLTKLRKLAEMRQIVDAGLEVQLADPAIPDTIKNVMHKVLASVQEAVPYTQHDVTVLQRSQENNPDMTLQQLIKGKGLGASSAAPVKPYSDAEKERRYQEWKKTHASE
jgi:hypothetical protein